jgi:hypothetical protein
VLVSVEFVERKVEENRSGAAAAGWERKEVARVQRGLPWWVEKEQRLHAVFVLLFLQDETTKLGEDKATGVKKKN